MVDAYEQRERHITSFLHCSAIPMRAAWPGPLGAHSSVLCRMVAESKQDTGTARRLQPQLQVGEQHPGSCRHRSTACAHWERRISGVHPIDINIFPKQKELGPYWQKLAACMQKQSNQKVSCHTRTYLSKQRRAHITLRKPSHTGHHPVEANVCRVLMRGTLIVAGDGCSRHTCIFHYRNERLLPVRQASKCKRAL